MIARHIYKVVKDTTKHFPITLLSGPRQIGKSTLLYNHFINDGYSYISLDDKLELLTAKNDPRVFLEIHKAPLIIDEAQRAPELFFELERIVNESRLKKGNKESNSMYILSGSQRKKLFEASEESLSGRVGIVDMSNLSINEIIERESTPFMVEINQLYERTKNIELTEIDIFKYIVRGFFPALYDDKTMPSHIYYSSYISTYLEKDIKEIIDIKDELKFYNFIRLLASNTSEELIYDNYANQVGVSVNTIKSWIDTLVSTGVIYLVETYNDESITKRIIKRPKMYFFDTGLAAYLCGIDSSETLRKSFLKGRFFETFVFNEIRKSYLNAGINQKLYYYRDSKQNEVDLVLIRNGELSLIEIKSGQSFHTSSTNAFQCFENTKLIKGKNALICNAATISILSNGTIIVPVKAI